MKKYKYSIEFETESTGVQLVIELMQSVINDTMKHLFANIIRHTLEVCDEDCKKDGY